jgi:hypothetical protein
VGRSALLLHTVSLDECSSHKYNMLNFNSDGCKKKYVAVRLPGQPIGEREA